MDNPDGVVLRIDDGDQEHLVVLFEQIEERFHRIADHDGTEGFEPFEKDDLVSPGAFVLEDIAGDVAVRGDDF